MLAPNDAQQNIAPVSVLIPCYRRPETVRRTIRSYLAQNMLPSEIIIVDQSETDEVRRAICSLTQDAVPVSLVYIHSKTPSSTAARNIALRAAQNDLCVFSDDDVDLLPHTFAETVALMSDPTVAMVAGLDVNTSHQSYGSSAHFLRYLALFSSFRKRHMGHVTASMLGVYPDAVHGRVETEWAMGYYFAIRKSLADGIEWDETLQGYAYGEDLDFSHRYYLAAKREGKQCFLCDRIVVDHLASKEYRIATGKNTILFVCNREYFSYKWNTSFLTRFACRWTNFVVLLQRVFHKNHPQQMWDAMQICRKNRRSIRRGDMRFLRGVCVE